MPPSVALIYTNFTSKPRKMLSDYKFHISILAAIFLILIGTTIFRYTQVVSTVLVGTTSDIIVDINYFF